MAKLKAPKGSAGSAVLSEPRFEVSLSVEVPVVGPFYHWGSGEPVFFESTECPLCGQLGGYFNEERRLIPCDVCWESLDAELSSALGGEV